MGVLLIEFLSSRKIFKPKWSPLNLLDDLGQKRGDPLRFGKNPAQKKSETSRWGNMCYSAEIFKGDH